MPTYRVFVPHKTEPVEFNASGLEWSSGVLVFPDADSSESAFLPPTQLFVRNKKSPDWNKISDAFEQTTGARDEQVVSVAWQSLEGMQVKTSSFHSYLRADEPPLIIFETAERRTWGTAVDLVGFTWVDASNTLRPAIREGLHAIPEWAQPSATSIPRALWKT